MHNRHALPAFLVFLQILGGIAICVVATAFPIGILSRIMAFASPFFFFINGWALYAFFRYREGRQDELHQVLLAAVDRQVPLAPAVKSYLHDAPRIHPPTFVRFCLLVGKFLGYVFLFPLYLYCRIWFGWRTYDTLLAMFIGSLERGESLAEAFHELPGVASHEVRLAAEVGEATGSLGACLKGVSRERWSAAWLEVVPRLLYPCLVLLFVSSITTFLMLFIVPRFKRIFDEFGETLPAPTLAIMNVWAAAAEYSWLIPLLMLAGLMLVAILIVNPGVRWRTPLIGRLYRSGIQGEILRTLGRLLAAGQTVPQALGFLTRSHVLPAAVVRRLDAASKAVERGEPLNDALNNAGLLPTTMSPLLQTSERVGTLPWALVALGDNLSGRAFRLVRLTSLVLGPVMVVLVGVVVGFIALGMFLPLIKLLTRLAE